MNACSSFSVSQPGGVVSASGANTVPLEKKPSPEPSSQASAQGFTGCLNRTLSRASLAHATLVATTPAGKTIAARAPEVWVFDSFGSGGIDVDGDGMGDVAHGEVVAAIISGRTGVQPHKFQVEENARPVGTLRVLDSLLARKDVSNLYLNFSISANEDAEVATKLASLAKRGAHIYVAAGNTDVNPLALAVQPNPNMHVVGASAGVVGGKSTSKLLSTFRTPTMTEVFNGNVVPTRVRGGVDLTNDGQADITQRQIAATPFSPAGLRLKDVDRTAMVVARKELLTIKPDVDNGVVSVKAMRASGLIDAKVLGDLHRTTGQTPAQLDQLYVHLDELGLQQLSLGDAGGVMLYSVNTLGRLEPVRQKSILEGVPATSFATPNALARDVLAAMGRPR
jgi:hypothetical protein